MITGKAIEKGGLVHTGRGDIPSILPIRSSSGGRRSFSLIKLQENLCLEWDSYLEASGRYAQSIGPVPFEQPRVALSGGPSVALLCAATAPPLSDIRRLV